MYYLIDRKYKTILFMDDFWKLEKYAETLGHCEYTINSVDLLNNYEFKYESYKVKMNE